MGCRLFRHGFIAIKISIFSAFLICASARAQVSQSAASPTGGVQNNSPLRNFIEEFFLSEAVRNEDPGELQITFSTDSRQGLGSNLTLELEYGLTKRLQLSSYTAYGLSATSKSEVPAGWSTTSVGLQYQIVRSNSPFALTAGMSFGIPVRAGAELEFEPELLAAKSFRRIQVHASFVANVEQGTLFLEYNLASVYLVSHRWYPTLEFSGRRLNGENAFYVTPGLYRHIGRRLEVGIGLPLGVGGVAGGIGIVGKITWEIGGDKDDRTMN